jgi:hypothetical protein
MGVRGLKQWQVVTPCKLVSLIRNNKDDIVYLKHHGKWVLNNALTLFLKDKTAFLNVKSGTSLHMNGPAPLKIYYGDEPSLGFMPINLA